MEQTGHHDYDLLVIGGGAGGLTAAKEAAGFGKRVLLLDSVTPSPKGSVWGWKSGDSVPRKLLHQAALLGQAFRDAPPYGWRLHERVPHGWRELCESVQQRLKALSFECRHDLRSHNVTYLHAHAELLGPHTVQAGRVETLCPGSCCTRRPCWARLSETHLPTAGGSTRGATDVKGKWTRHTAATIVIAAGERPRYPGIPGDREYCITSDDLLTLPHAPGRTLVVGGSIEGLEVAGILSGLGLDVTVMEQSVLLEGFDRKMTKKVENHMYVHGVNFLHRYAPTKIELIEEGSPGKLRVTAESTEGSDTYEGEFNTVLLAIGREACTDNLGLDRIGVQYDHSTGKILVNEEEQTSVSHIYAVGSVQEPTHTHLSAQAGQLLAQRLYGGRSTKCDYTNVPTVVLAPMEYAACGLTEERANEAFGEENVEVYHSSYWPVEWSLPARNKNSCYAKVLCHIPDSMRVVGVHVLGPSAAELIQGFAAALRCGLTKEQLDSTAAVHPACAQVLTNLTVTQRETDAMMVRGNC